MKRDMKTAASKVISGKREISKTGKNSPARDYRSVKWDASKIFRTAAGSTGCVLLLSFFFYRSLLAAVPLSFIGVLYFRKKGKSLAAKDRKTLESQFGEAIRSVETALKAGYSVENAFVQSGKDMERQFGREAFICGELEAIRRGMILNITLEEMLGDLGERSGSEAITDFAKVFAIAKRYGGNMPGIISSAADTISLQIETAEEIEASLSGRRMELNIMRIMPFGILAYVGVTSPGYFDPLYGNLTGVLLMTGLLCVYLAGFVLGDKVLAGLEEV
ncbi:MAG: type II secretion system F family protein [Lachnospiraceae bacterium]|nr:type II secretion system F family protein [Lachnospiraceae bacterium]